jgi:hypothetical protein
MEKITDQIEVYSSEITTAATGEPEDALICHT